MSPVEKQLENKATVEFTSSFVIPKPALGIYSVNLGGAGYLRITLPEKEKTELLARLRSDPPSAHAWLDSTTEAIRKQYEKTSAQAFTFTLQPIGGATQAVPQAAPRDTSAFRPAKIERVEAPKIERVGEMARMQESPAEEKKKPVEKPGISVPRPTILSGTGTKEDPFLVQFPEVVGAKDAIGSVPVTIHPELRFESAGLICYKITLQQAYFTDQRIASTTREVSQFIIANAYSALKNDSNVGANAATLAQQAGSRIGNMVSQERIGLEREGKKLAEYLAKN